jgi:hypothetical protein
MPLRGIAINSPGRFGLNTQDDINVGSDPSSLSFASEARNGVIDTSGRLVARKDFVLQTAGFSGTVETVYTHRLNDGTEVLMSAAAGQIYSGLGTLTSRCDYRAGSQVVDVGGAKTGARATGLANDATSYTYQISVDGGGTQTINVTGSTAQTYTNLITQINADITGATVALEAGNLKFTSGTTGASSSIALTSGGGGTNLFSTLTNFVAVRSASAGTTTDNNWQFATLSSKIYAAQKGRQFVCLNESTFAAEALTGQPWTGHPNIVISADGRLWAADDETGSNRYTVWWSDLLNGKVWNSGDAGSLNLQNVWPTGQDYIVGIEMLSGRLLILGRNSILLYTLPATHDPADMSLTDVVENLGCVARDSIILAGGDLYFLSDNGLYRIPRLAQVTSLVTLQKVSKLVADDFVSTYASETMEKVRAGYNPVEKFLVVNAPTANKVWCFHLDRIIPEHEVPAATDWTNASNPFRGFCFDKSGNWYAAMTDGIGKYTGYTPDGAPSAYDFSFYTQWSGLGDDTRLKLLKSWALTLETASGQTGTFRWQQDFISGTTRTADFTCNATEFAEDPGIGIVKGQLGGHCNTARAGFTTTINGDAVSVHGLRVYATPGTTKIR